MNYYLETTTLHIYFFKNSPITEIVNKRVVSCDGFIKTEFRYNESLFEVDGTLIWEDDTFDIEKDDDLVYVDKLSWDSYYKINYIYSYQKISQEDYVDYSFYIDKYNNI